MMAITTMTKYFWNSHKFQVVYTSVEADIELDSYAWDNSVVLLPVALSPGRLVRHFCYLAPFLP